MAWTRADGENVLVNSVGVVPNSVPAKKGELVIDILLLSLPSLRQGALAYVSAICHLQLPLHHNITTLACPGLSHVSFLAVCATTSNRPRRPSHHHPKLPPRH